MVLLSKKFLFILDIVLMSFSLFVVLAFRYSDFSLFPGPQTREFLINFSVIHFFWAALLYSFDFYDIYRGKNLALLARNTFLFAVLAFVTGVVYFYLNFNSLISPKTILFFDVILFSLLVYLRSLFLMKINELKFR